MKIIASLECQNIEPNAPKTPKTPWKTRTGTNTVIAKIAISIAIQSIALMSNFTPQSRSESVSNNARGDTFQSLESSVPNHPTCEEIAVHTML
jgi:hypothetical protein